MSLPSSAATVTVYVSPAASVTPAIVMSWPVAVLMSNEAASRTFEAVGQRVAVVGVRRRDRVADVCTRRRILIHAPRGTRALAEHGRDCWRRVRSVDPVPVFDQSLVPSAFVARTSTS